MTLEDTIYKSTNIVILLFKLGTIDIGEDE